MTISEQHQTMILNLGNKTSNPLSYEKIGEDLQLDVFIISDLLAPLVRMGLVRKPLNSDLPNTTVTLSKLALQLLSKNSPEKVLKIACKNPFAGVSSNKTIITEQEFYNLFEAGRLSLSTKYVDYEYYAKSYEAERFFSQFTRWPNLSKQKDSVIFHIDEIAKTICFLINYVVDAAEKRNIPIRNIPFLQPLRLATLSGPYFIFLGFAYCCMEVKPRETEWRSFRPLWPVWDHSPLRHTPDTVMTVFSSYLQNLAGSLPWHWFYIPWDLELALKNNPDNTHFYRINEVECRGAVNKILEERHTPMKTLNHEKYNEKPFVIKYDAFISQASEDKDFVSPLAESLEKAGLRIWYDEFEIKVGDSLRRSIDRGLSNSRFGIVIFSSAFFKKNWPQYELDGLVSKEMHGAKVILPIWHKISKDEVEAYSPTLADKFALNSSILSLKEIVSRLTQVLKEEKT